MHWKNIKAAATRASSAAKSPQKQGRQVRFAVWIASRVNGSWILHEVSEMRGSALRNFILKLNDGVEIHGCAKSRNEVTCQCGKTWSRE